MKFAAYCLAFFAMLLIALAASAPATLLDRRVATTTDGALRIADTRGTVWRGEGQLTDAKGTWRVPVAWQLAPRALLAGRIEVELGASDGGLAPQGHVDASADAIAANDLRIRVPAVALASALPERTRVTPGGFVTVLATMLAWKRDRVEGNATLAWPDARIATPFGLLRLGTVNLPLSPRGSGLAGPLTASGGDLRVDGTIVADTAGLRVDATLTPSPSLPADLAQALRGLGNADANGAVRVSWRAGGR
jgi:Type II secretion system (T2SS), protein N